VRVKSPAKAVPDDPYMGKLLDKKYQIDELLGIGGMGRVYKATQLALDKVVCVKVLRSGMMQDDTLVGRFHREARASSRLNHPNSIAVTDFGQAQEDGSLYMVMEFVPGKDLGKVIREDRPIAEKRIIHIMDQVLSALADAHAAGIVHRDLKPENIMVTDLRGTKDFVKVLDFGIAKIQEAQTEPGLTQAGMVCGTPEYMSPEQARGEELDARSDVYAAGVIIYQMVVGQIPFSAPTAMGIVTKHLTEAPVPPSKMDSIKISPAMEAVILKSMSKNRDGRQKTALALQQELNQVLHQKTAPAQETPLGTNLFEEPTGTHDPAPVTPAAMTETKDSVPAMKAKKASKAWLIAVIIFLLVAGGAAAGYFLWWLPRQQAGGNGPVAATDAGTAQDADAGTAKDAEEPKVVEKDAGVVVAAADIPKVEEIPEAAKIHYDAGKEFMAQQKIEKAIAAFRKAVRKAPDYAKAYRALGTCFMRQGKIKRAKKFFRLYLEKAPPDAEDRADIQELIDSL
jgi:serine/threonine protein kinase